MEWHFHIQSEFEVGVETFRRFFLKGDFPNSEFILKCKKFVCGSQNIFLRTLHAGFQVI